MNDQKDNDGLEEQAVAAEAPAEAGAALTEEVVASEASEGAEEKKGKKDKKDKKGKKGKKKDKKKDKKKGKKK